MAQHLIHIGYPKAGSTFLQVWFERHPDLHYKPGALGGFHNVYEMARPLNASYKYYVTSCEALSTPSKYAGMIRLDFGGAEPEEQKAPLRARQANVCALLKSLYPNSRILITTRGFKGMLVSGYSQFVKVGGREHPAEMCRKYIERLEAGYEHHHDIDQLIAMYADAFGEENLIVLPYELLRDDQNKFLAVLEERLGLEHVEIKLGRVNPSLSPEELYWYPLLSRAVAAGASRLGARGYRRVYGWYVRGTLENRFHRLVKALAWARPGKKISREDFPDDILNYLEGKATRLKTNHLYAPYAAEYLWDKQSPAKGETHGKAAS